MGVLGTCTGDIEAAAHERIGFEAGSAAQTPTSCRPHGSF
jgi:hypothetical protein